MTKCLALLTWNEIEAVKVLFDKIPKDFDEVFVIDPGSTDGTIEFFKEKNIPVYIQEKKGRGVAFLMAANISKSDLIVFFGVDGNENPEDIKKLFAELENGADMAICSRFMKGSRNEEDEKFIPLRKWANQAFTLLVNIFFNRTGKYITDTINGFRGFRREKLLQLNLTADGFAIEFQATIRSLKKGYVIKEIPTIEGARIGGKSKAKSIPTGLKILGIFIKELLKK
ncbi:MAG: glycosyltransferase [Candidatus Goldbacteria bacterium]|nr:glycosyltransferase [Candidatus Goldiibacteriota bacterium]